MSTVMITGGSRGIGAAAVRHFAAQGHRVYFLYEKEHGAAQAVAAETGATPICCDVADTAAVIIPITSRTYTTPEFTATVSGYQPSLDSITIHAQRTIITNNPPAAKSKPWSIGIAAGIGAGRGGITPFIGITLQYSLIRF